MKQILNSVTIGLCLIAAIYLLFIGCENSNESAHSEKLSPDQALDLINEALSQQTFEPLEVGDFSIYEENYKIGFNDPEISLVNETQILEILPLNTEIFEVKVSENVLRYSNSKPGKNNIFERTIQIGKEFVNISSSSELNLLDRVEKLVFEPNYNLYSEDQEFSVFIQDFTVRETTIESPNSSKETNCEQERCFLDAIEIKFLLVEDTKPPHRIAVHRLYLKNSPYLSGVFFSCVGQDLEIQEKLHFVQQCRILRGFGNLGK